MNCKPKDLARIIMPGPLQDKIVRLAELDTHPACIVPCWLYEGERLPGNRPGTFMVSLRDSILRPINNPPDDAVDEMLLLVPSPVWDRAWSEA